MNILYAKAGKLQNAKFLKTIGSKIYSYTGEEEEGFLIEELIYNAIKNDLDIVNSKFQVIVETENHIYFITYEDQTEEKYGEDTISYSLGEFSKEDISNIISELLEDYPLIAAEIKDNKLIIKYEDFEKEYNIKDIPKEILISKKTRIKNFVSSKVIEIILIIAIILIPALTIEPIKKTLINNREIAIKKYKNDYNRLLKEKASLEKKNFRLKKEFEALKNREDILKNPMYDFIWEG